MSLEQEPFFERMTERLMVYLEDKWWGSFAFVVGLLGVVAAGMWLVAFTFVLIFNPCQKWEQGTCTQQECFVLPDAEGETHTICKENTTVRAPCAVCKEHYR